MRKLLKTFGTCMLLAALVWCGTVIADRQHLSSDLIRLHVVADSDSAEDQAVKLQVRDAVVNYVSAGMDGAMTKDEAQTWLQAHLDGIRDEANRALAAAGASETATVSLQKEAFPTRHYDTFSLPAGVYASLRVNIGQAQGQNWWCVVFPSLCLPATTEDFSDTAAGAGFPDSVTGALTGEQPYQIRFFFLDCLGMVENFFFGS